MPSLGSSAQYTVGANTAGASDPALARFRALAVELRLYLHIGSMAIKLGEPGSNPGQAAIAQRPGIYWLCPRSSANATRAGSRSSPRPWVNCAAAGDDQYAGSPRLRVQSTTEMRLDIFQVSSTRAKRST